MGHRERDRVLRRVWGSFPGFPLEPARDFSASRSELDIRGCARIDSGRLTTRIETLDLEAVAISVIAEFRAQAEAKGLAIDSVIAALPPLVSDRRLVRIIVSNLVSNAVKFALTGRIRVTVDYEGDRHRIIVADTGVGIESANTSRIFEAFEQIAPIVHKHNPGVGLGLSLVRDMVDALGGSVSVVSRSGRGSVFTVELPRKSTAQDTCVDLQGSTSLRRPSPFPSTPFESTDPSVHGKDIPQA